MDITGRQGGDNARGKKGYENEILGQTKLDDVSVIHVTDKSLSPDMISLLQMGMGFCPGKQGDICKMKIYLFKYV